MPAPALSESGATSPIPPSLPPSAAELALVTDGLRSVRLSPRVLSTAHDRESRRRRPRRATPLPNPLPPLPSSSSRVGSDAILAYLATAAASAFCPSFSLAYLSQHRFCRLPPPPPFFLHGGPLSPSPLRRRSQFPAKAARRLLSFRPTVRRQRGCSPASTRRIFRCSGHGIILERQGQSSLRKSLLSSLERASE